MRRGLATGVSVTRRDQGRVTIGRSGGGGFVSRRNRGSAGWREFLRESTRLHAFSPMQWRVALTLLRRIAPPLRPFCPPIQPYFFSRILSGAPLDLSCRCSRECEAPAEPHGGRGSAGASHSRERPPTHNGLSSCTSILEGQSHEQKMRSQPPLPGCRLRSSKSPRIASRSVPKPVQSPDFKRSIA